MHIPANIGDFVARYFQVLAWLSIVSMIVVPVFTDGIHIDLNFILFFWVAHHLKQHNPTARKWTLRICGFVLSCLVVMIIFAGVVGTQNMTVSFFRRIDNPTFLQVAAVVASLCLIVGIPFALLMTRQAKREFISSGCLSAHNHSPA